MNKNIGAAIVLGIVSQLAFANALNECLATCVTAYNKCIEDRNPLEACQLAQKNCELECRNKS